MENLKIYQYYVNHKNDKKIFLIFKNLIVIFTKGDLFKLQNTFKDLIEYEEALLKYQKEIEYLCKDRKVIIWIPDDFRNPNEFKSFIELKFLEFFTISSFNEKLNFLKKPDSKEVEFPFNVKTSELLDILSSIYTLASKSKTKKKRSSSFFNPQKDQNNPSLTSSKSAFKISTKSNEGNSMMLNDTSSPISILGKDLFDFFSSQNFEIMKEKNEILKFLEMLIEIGFLIDLEKHEYKFNETTSYLLNLDGFKSYLSFQSAIFIETLLRFFELKFLKYISIQDGDLNQFYKLFSNGFEIKNRSHKFKKYNDSFIANESIKWMVENFNISKPICEAFGEMFCEFEIFISNNQPFYDTMNFIKFISEIEFKEKIENFEKKYKYLNF